MMDKRRIRKSDVYCGLAVSLFGVWIIAQASAMPMKDSWGGVTNVWYVSPALLPLLIGSALAVLGLILFGIGIMTVGPSAILQDLETIVSRDLASFLLSDGTVRFLSVISLFLIFVFLYLPRIDFFISSTVFLFCMMSLFFCCEGTDFKRLMIVYVIGGLALALVFKLGLARLMDDLALFGGDLFAIMILLAFYVFSWNLFYLDRIKLSRYRLCISIPVLTAGAIGIIFKYALLVPLPYEGLVTMLLDHILYLE